MPLTNETVIQAHEALALLIKNDKEERYVIPKASRQILAANLNRTFPVIEKFSNMHNALVRQYGKSDNKGGYEIKPGSENEDAFKVEKNNLLQEDSGIESLGTVTLNDLPDNVAIDLLAMLQRSGQLAA